MQFDRLAKKLHIYAGLLNFTSVIVLGVAGLVVTFDAPDIFHNGGTTAVELRTFSVPEIATDKDVALAVEATLQPENSAVPFTTRNADHQLVVHFYSVNGLKRVTVLEDRQQLRIETMRNSVWRFVDNLHASTIAERTSGWAIRAWSWYVEFSIWCLLGMVLSGLWMGLRARFPYRLGQAAFFVGLGMAVVLFALVK